MKANEPLIERVKGVSTSISLVMAVELRKTVKIVIPLFTNNLPS